MLVIKRNGQEVEYDESRIFQALLGAFSETGGLKEGHENSETLVIISDLTSEITDRIIEDGFSAIDVELIQDYVMDALLESDYPKVAKAYIQFAERRKIARESIPEAKTVYPKVQKKNGRVELFAKEKLEKAILSAAPHLIEPGPLAEVISKISRKAQSLEAELITTDELHDLVEKQLKEDLPEVFEQYAIYRRYKKNMAKSYDAARKASERILFGGDNENANRDSQLNSTKQTLTAETFMKRLVRDFELSPEARDAHDQGWIYIHDIGARYLRQINCCLFDMGNLLKGGFFMNGAKYLEPKSIGTALSVMGDVTLQASAQQYGGFTIPEIDTILAPYAEKSFKKHLNTLSELDVEEAKLETLAKKMTIREIEQGVQGFETKLNSVSSSLGQIPFVSISFGLNTSLWGREISKAILKNRKEGMGEDKITAIFPKLIMLMRREVNRDVDSPNRDIYNLAIECSQTRLYPDYLSLDGAELGNNLAEVYERSGQAVSPMGCRAYLSPYWSGDKEIYTGRGNTGAVTLNLPKIALEAGGDLDRFYELIDVYADVIWNFHKSYIGKIGKQKASTSPLFYCEGGAWMSLDYNDEIAPVIKAFTSSLGYIGLEEAVRALTGGSLKNNKELGLEIVKHLKENVAQAQEKYGFLTALYSTPAESLCYTMQKNNQATYGEIEGVTDREYLTNSFHIPVWEEITVPEKIAFESDFHKIATGGRISYCEFPWGTPVEVLQQAVDFAMDQGEYFGVNIVSSSCLNCSNSGEFRDTCPMCGSVDIVVVSRVCGYLSFERAKGDKKGRFNPGKKAEVLDRVKHAFDNKGGNLLK